MTEKLARDMSEAERAEALAAIKRKPTPEPMDVTIKAKDLTPAERAAWLKEHARRFG
jgi:predicted protein tyrosine phosphatase